jgi:hypothetical protein
MANAQKYTQGQIGGLVRHYERAKKEDGTYYTFGNQEIDTSKTHLNYNLAPMRNQLAFIKERTSQVKCLNRSDVNVMCSWVITAPKELTEDEYKLFFQQAYLFLNQRYADGSDKNVISAYVHMDETSPHLHYAFVPVVHDKKKGIDKVSAKLAVDRWDLKTFHQDLEQHMAAVFGREVGIMNEATKDGNKTIVELKRATALTEQAELDGHIKDEKNVLADLLVESTAVKLELDSNKAEVHKLKTELKRLTKELAPLIELQNLDTSTEKVVLPEKNILGKISLLPQDAELLDKQAKAYRVNKPKIDSLQEDRKKVTDRENAVTVREKNADKRNKDLNNKASIVESKAKEVYEVYQRQAGINQLLESAERDRDNLSDQLTEERKKSAAADALSNQVRSLMQELANTVKAIGMFKYDKTEGYAVSLSKKQERLLDGITNRAKQVANNAGFGDIAETINNYIGISEEIKRAQPKVNRGHEDR